MTALNELIAELGAHQEAYRPQIQHQIADLLDRHHVAYLQEQPLVFYHNDAHQTDRPAFWLPQHGDLIIDIGEPSEVTELKERYDNNGFENIIVTPDYTHRPHWQEELYTQIQGYIQPGSRGYHLSPLAYR